MRALVERHGDGRTNARTALSVASQQMAKEISALKAASKGFATATSQLPSILKVAHELTESELKLLKKLLDHVEQTKHKLKKYALWADENAKDASKLAALLAKPGPSDRIGPEPDPNRPFRS